MTLGERNPNLMLDGLPVLYIPRYFYFFVRGLPFGRPSWFLQGQTSFSNLADLTHGRILVGLVFMVVPGCCTWLVADIVTILSYLCYNLNGQRLSSNTLSTQLPNVLGNFT